MKSDKAIAKRLGTINLVELTVAQAQTSFPSGAITPEALAQAFWTTAV